MDSRDDYSRLRKLNDKTVGPFKDPSELDSELTIESTISSTTFDSIDSSASRRTMDDDREHIKGCASKYRNNCTCELLTRYKMRQEKRKQWSAHLHREVPSNDTINSTILAGNVGSTSGGTSRASSDSFHSAQSAIDDLQVVDWIIQEKSTIGSNESTAGSLNIAVNESKIRDTNHNIDSTTEGALDTDKPSVSSDTTDETSYMMPFLEKLCKEIDVSCPNIDEKPPNIMKRLSISFAKNPAGFKERLLTIIEESDLNSYQQRDDKSYEHLSRLTTEFRKVCKYILDESMPAQMLALSADPSSSILSRISKSPVTSSTLNFPKRKSSVDFHTPVQDDQRRMKKVYRKTPKNFMDNGQKSNQSPLCIAMLKKTNGTPRTPPRTPKNTTPVTDELRKCSAILKGSNESPKTPLRTPKNIPYNDSFLYWEDYADKHATPVSESKKSSLMRRSKSVPDMAVQIQIERIKRTGEIQYHCLDDSPQSSSTYLQRKKSVENDLYDTFDSHGDTNMDLAESILEEVVKKRLRCVETEKTIREIDAASTSAEDSSEGDNVLEYLHSVVGRCSEYHQCLIQNRDVIEKTVRKIVEKRTPKARASVKTPGKSMKSAKKIQQSVMSDLKRPAFVVNFRRRSPVAVSKSPRSKPTSSNRGETSLYLRGLSAKKTTSRSTSPAVRQATPSRITNRKLALTRSTPNLTLLKPVTSKLPPVAAGRTPSRPLSASRPPAKLSIARTPGKINGCDKLKTNSITVRSRPPRTPNPPLTKSKSIQYLPTICRTPATPASRGTSSSRKLSQSLDKPSVITNRHIQTPAKIGEKPAIIYRGGKFFNTPAKADLKTSRFFQTPAPAIQQNSSVLLKRGKFFETPVKPEVKKKAEIPSVLKVKKPFTVRPAYYGYDTVKSPVAEYIKSTDAKLVQNIRSKDNALLLTPKVKQTATSVETLRIKLGGNCGVKKNKREAENDENIPDAPMDSFPKVMYQPPATVYDINCQFPSSKLRGGNGKVLREINDRRVVVRHEGRIQDALAEQSIHISKPAEKSNYVGYSQAAKKPFK